MQQFEEGVSCSLLEATRALMQDDSEFVMDVFRETGIPFFWLRGFAKGQYKNPGINRIQYLYEYLSGKKLEV